MAENLYIRDSKEPIEETALPTEFAKAVAKLKAQTPSLGTDNDLPTEFAKKVAQHKVSKGHSK
ncbi:MAG: hypothetical protein KGJ06_00750 [Pseudomonadota bacterium]|nr:hypothetical protein [Pseudomonadota bacterium]